MYKFRFSDGISEIKFDAWVSSVESLTFSRDDPQIVTHWYNANYHRIDGPAIEWENGEVGWWLDGMLYDLSDYLDANHYITNEEKTLLVLKYS